MTAATSIHDESVIHLTRSRFPGFAREEFRVAPLEKGGSGRKFFRVASRDGASMIFVKYTPQRPENARYVEIADFLDAAGVRVPRVFFHDPAEGLIWMQDLGETDLWARRNDPWHRRRRGYKSALDAVARMHGAATAKHRISPLALEMEFDEQLYLWEQNYFVENCLGGVFGLPPETAARYAGLPVLREMAGRLAREPRVLVHRDFQSQNILLHDGVAWLIDFQGMRPGLPQYDVASLLYDPYVRLSGPERDELLTHYRAAAAREGVEITSAFDELFRMCAAQRLMQALGAYGFLGKKCGRPDFLEHVPAARASLREVASGIDGMDDIVRLLEDLP